MCEIFREMPAVLHNIVNEYVFYERTAFIKKFPDDFYTIFKKKLIEDIEFKSIMDIQIDKMWNKKLNNFQLKDEIIDEIKRHSRRCKKKGISMREYLL